VRNRIELQPARTSTAAETQETRYAAPMGNAKTATAFVNLLAIGGTGPTGFKIQFDTTTTPDRGSAYWTPIGSLVDFGGTPALGALSVPLTNLGDLLRWRITTLTGGSGISYTFQIVVLTADT
jgi:hypothetical protein